MSDVNADLPIFVKWIDFLKWLFLITEKFPKKVRFTFADRINNIALGIVEGLVEARYSRQKLLTLKQVNVDVEKLRILLRICYESKFLPLKAYEHAMISLSEIGKMLGGWMKQQEPAK